MEEENLEETNEETEETDEDGFYRRAVEITSGQDIDWEAEEEREKKEKQAELNAIKENERSAKQKEQKFIESQDPIAQIKLRMGFTDSEKSWIVEKAKADKTSIKVVMENQEVKDLIQYRRKMNIPKIPWVLDDNKENENTYLSSRDFGKKISKRSS